MDERILLTSESVTEGHPDKVADQISDAILDAILEKDPFARVACETIVTTGIAFVAGEISTNCYVDIPRVVRDTVKEIGYTRAKYGFDGDTCAVVTAIDEQSPDIAQGVNKALEVRIGEATDEEIESIGAGDQGIMVGYACTETEELMPMPIMMAHKLAKRLAYVRKSKILPYLRPDGKSQVTVEYDSEGNPVRIDTVIISAQHHPAVDVKQIAGDLRVHVLEEVIPEDLMDGETKFLVNPTGRFVLGGPMADTGLTGRKIMVDTYGGVVPHGGGCFSGKDPTKVDRSGAYMARYAAKNIVAAGLARKCIVQVAYAIGVARPVSIAVDTFGTGVIPDERIVTLVRRFFDFRPAAIIRDLNLRRPIYRKLATYGHMGRVELGLPWEQTDKAEELKKAAESM